MGGGGLNFTKPPVHSSRVPAARHYSMPEADDDSPLLYAMGKRKISKTSQKLNWVSRKRMSKDWRHESVSTSNLFCVGKEIGDVL